MQEQLAAITESLETAQSRLRRLSDNLSEERWTRRPSDDAWSAAECVEHLNITSRAYVPLLRDAVAEARLKNRPPSRHYSHDALGWFLSKMFAPLRHVGKFKFVRVKTLPAFVPNPARSRTEILSEFVRLQGDLISLVRSADGLPIDGVKIVSPFGGRMKYDAYSAFTIVARHQQRHLAQAEEAAR